MDYFRAAEKRAAVRQAEAAGEVADSLDVRLALIERAKAEGWDTERLQTELKRIKRGAKAAGKKTRAQAWRDG